MFEMVVTTNNKENKIMNLLLTGCFKYTEEQLDQLQQLGYKIYFMQQEKDALPLNAAEINATVCNGLFLSHDISEFTNLKFIQLTSAGCDRVPVEIIKERGIKLYNARGVYSIPMAEWVVYRVLEHYKQGWFFRKEQTACRWTKFRDLREIAGKKVAVVGAGNVGQEVAKRFQAFGVEIVGFDVHMNETPYFDKMQLTNQLVERIGEYDIVIITAPLLPSTKGLISRKVLCGLKEEAVLVNIARGGLIDEDALCEILAERKDLFAVLDVFVQEPLPAESLLWKLDNVALSPHNSFVSDSNNLRMFDVMYHNLKNFINRVQ